MSSSALYLLCLALTQYLTKQESFSYFTAEENLYDSRPLPSDPVPPAPEGLGGEEDGPPSRHHPAITAEGFG